MEKTLVRIAVIICFLILCPEPSFTQGIEPVILESPQQNTTVIGKKPLIKASINIPFKKSGLLIVLDGTDVTDLADITGKGFTYKPVAVMGTGFHTLSVSIMTEDGQEIQKSFSFSTRQTRAFEEFYSENELTGQYEGVLTKPKSVDDVPYSKMEANLKSGAKVSNGGWHFEYLTNVRYFDQSLPVTEPLEKGVTLADYVMKGSYQNRDLQVYSEVGNIQIQETPYTVQQLGRRGGKIAFSYKNVSFGAFNVKSQEIFGLDDGPDVDGDLNNHIRGISGEVHLLHNRVDFKAVHITGGEREDSYSLWTPEIQKRGDVTGFVLNTDFFDQKFQTLAELAFSKYDPDRSDEFSYVHDTAYKVGGMGQWGKFSYGAYYEYVGKEYESIANQGLQKDIAGISLEAGVYLDTQSMQFSFSRYRDNVEDDELYPRVTTYQAAFNYSFNKFQSLPMTLSYQSSIQDSSHEPEYTPSVKMFTDTVTASVNYMKGNWTFALQGGYSFQNDRTSDDADTTTVNGSFSPGYNGEHLSVTPSFAYNMSEYHPTGVRTDNYVFNLDLRGDFFERKILYELAGTYNIIQATDDSVDQEMLNTNFRIAYVPKENIRGLFTPCFGIMGKYDRMIDHNYPDAYKNDFILMFFVSTSALFSF